MTPARILLVLLLGACASYDATDPPTSLRECREDAYLRFNQCIEQQVNFTDTCQSMLEKAVDTCVKAFPKEGGKVP